MCVFVFYIKPNFKTILRLGFINNKFLTYKVFVKDCILPFTTEILNT